MALQVLAAGASPWHCWRRCSASWRPAQAASYRGRSSTCWWVVPRCLPAQNLAAGAAGCTAQRHHPPPLAARPCLPALTLQADPREAFVLQPRALTEGARCFVQPSPQIALTVGGATPARPAAAATPGTPATREYGLPLPARIPACQPAHTSVQHLRLRPDGCWRMHIRPQPAMSPPARPVSSSGGRRCEPAARGGTVRRPPPARWQPSRRRRHARLAGNGHACGAVPGRTV